MNWRVVRAGALLELRRDWPVLFKLLITIALCSAAVTFAPRGIAMVAAFISLCAGMMGVLAGATTAMRERMMGRVVWWRTLPVARSELVAGRLLGAAIGALLLPVALVPVIAAASRVEYGLPGAAAIITALLMLALLAMAIAIVSTAATLKLRMEYLFLVAIFGGAIDELLFGGRVEEWLDHRSGLLAEWFLASLDAGASSLLLLAALAVLMVAVVTGALLARWAYATATDSDPGSLPGAAAGISRLTWRGIRYPGARGPVTAAMWLQLRIIAERLPQQLALLLGGALVLPFLPPDVARFVAVYLPIMAVGIPAGIVGRTAFGKTTGTLEGIATLPVRREYLALGTVIAIGVAALVATGAIAVVRLAADRPLGLLTAFAVWGLMTGSTSIGNGMAAWFKPRHFGIVSMVAVITLGGLTFAMIPFLMSPQTAGAAAIKLPVLALGGGLAGLLLLAPLGGALYGRGLERFELIRK